MSQEASAATDAGAAGGAEQNQAAAGQDQGQTQGQEPGSTGRTLLTQPEEGAQADAAGADGQQQQAQKDDVQKAAGEADAVVPDKPEGYALQFAEGLAVDDALLGGFKNTAHELGLNQSQAQKLADMYVKHQKESATSMHAAQAKALDDARQGWEKEITARPGFKQEVGDARRVLVQYGSPELSAIMDQSLMGSHPVFFDFVVKVGKALAEPELRGMGGSDKKVPLADRLWPTMK